MSDAPDGVLPLDKPPGPSSHDMVAAVRRALRTRRVGHTGTLDPFASGLLLMCIGAATRTAEHFAGLDKQYRASVRLGVATDTDDGTGTVLYEKDARHITRADVEASLAPLHGDVLQRPPAYSAKKQRGERAYAAARAGRPLLLEPVRVRIHAIRVLGCEPPFLELEIECGSGTYIRAIARDLGESLGVGAHLTALRRTAVGTHRVDHALPPDALADADAVRAALIPTVQALAHLPRVQLDAAHSTDVRHGRAIRAGEGLPDAPVVLLTEGERLVALAERSAGVLKPRKVFP